MKSIGKVRGTSTVSVRIHDVYARYLLIQSLFRKNKTNLNKNTNIHKNNKIKNNIIKPPEQLCQNIPQHNMNMCPFYGCNTLITDQNQVYTFINAEQFVCFLQCPLIVRVLSIMGFNGIGPNFIIKDLPSVLILIIVDQL